MRESMSERSLDGQRDEATRPVAGEPGTRPSTARTAVPRQTAGGRRKVTIFPTFHRSSLEQAYWDKMYPALAHKDLIIAVCGTVMMSVVVRLALAAGLYTEATYGLLCILITCVPLGGLLFNSDDYRELRSLYMLVWMPTSTFCAIRCAQVLDSRTVSRVTLPLILLIRSHVLILLWANLSMTVPFRKHIFVHAAGVGAAMLSNEHRCRWALQLTPLTWIRPFASFMRRCARLPPPPAGSFLASPAGECTTVLSFFQMTAAYLLPCYISLLLEHRSRYDFLRGHYHNLQQQRLRSNGHRRHRAPGFEISPWTPGRLLSWHLLWLGSLAALLCWRASEAAVDWLHEGEDGWSAQGPLV